MRRTLQVSEDVFARFKKLKDSKSVDQVVTMLLDYFENTQKEHSDIGNKKKTESLFDGKSLSAFAALSLVGGFAENIANQRGRRGEAWDELAQPLQIFGSIEAVIALKHPDLKEIFATLSKNEYALKDCLDKMLRKFFQQESDLFVLLICGFSVLADKLDNNELPKDPVLDRLEEKLRISKMTAEEARQDINYLQSLFPEIMRTEDKANEQER